MILWVAFAVLTAVILAAVLAPLARASRSEDAGDAEALAVYRHQLAEVDADRARGLIDEAEAAAARTEISRRLLKRAKSADADQRWPSVSRARVALAAAVIVPPLTLAVYLLHGSPGLPGMPFGERAKAPPLEASLGDLIARVEARLRQHPEDGEGWDVIAPVYLKLGRYRDAANAYKLAAELKGETVPRLAGFAEATVFANDGIVTEEARLAYEKIRKLEPDRPEARFWLALAKEQDGQLPAALTDYKALLADAPATASWRQPLEERIADVSRRLQGKEPEPSRGPTAQDMAAAEKLTPAERAQMIAGMVDGLAERLKRNGRDLAGWQRLVRAYVVLNRKDDARAALGEARKHFGGDDKALAELSALATSLGLGS